jgi:hypothetical protein
METETMYFFNPKFLCLRAQIYGRPCDSTSVPVFKLNEDSIYKRTGVHQIMVAGIYTKAIHDAMLAMNISVVGLLISKRPANRTKLEFTNKSSR